MTHTDPAKVALVTGGTRGIGEAIVRHLIADGFTVHATYVSSAERAETLAQELTAAGGRVVFHRSDCASETDAQAIIDTVVEHSGRLDVLVNNAGITKDGLLMRMSIDDWNAVIQTNLTGVFLLCKAASKVMMRQRSGRIINMGSIVGLGGNAGQVNYSSAKAGLVGLTRSLAKELASRNVLVNCLAPGYVETDMTGKLNDEQKAAFTASIPLGRAASAGEIASVVAFFASDGASYLTGQVVNIDGGLAL